MHLVNFYVSADLVEQVEASLTDVIQSQTAIDLASTLPSPFREADIQELFKQIGETQSRLIGG